MQHEHVEMFYIVGFHLENVGGVTTDTIIHKKELKKKDAQIKRNKKISQGFDPWYRKLAFDRGFLMEKPSRRSEALI